MSERLERYLREIDHYLAVSRNSKEILDEIRSHILEKAGEEGGSEEAIEKAIAGYGRAREVAEKYIEGTEIIAPAFKKYLFRYTWLLFAVHLCLTIVALVTKTSITAFPFFIVPRMSVAIAFFYVPMAFIADFGLVALVLYLVTQRKQEMRLPWPRLFVPRRPHKRPRAWRFAVLALLFACGLFLAIRYRTLFFYTINAGPARSLLDPVSSLYFSILFLAMLACEVLALGVRFIVDSAWVNLARDILILTLLWIVWNGPIRPQYAGAHGIDLAFLGGAFAFVITVIAAVSFLESLVFVIREMASPAVEARR